MALNLSSCFLLIFLLPFLCIQALNNTSNINTNSSSKKKAEAFEFLKHLKGCHKGESVKGVHDLKEYLKRFGYLNYDSSNNSTHADDDDFDEVLESAVKTYQTNYHLKPTGSLNSETVKKMTSPRCGVADIINGTTRMQSGKYKHHSHTSFHTVSHYAFFDGNKKWPASKTHLTYAIDRSGRRDVLSPIMKVAFAKWASVSHFTFEEIRDYTTSDLVIGVYTRDHGDGSPFDGAGGTLAHATSPTSGLFHYDGDERWATGPVNGTFDLQTVALHEIGHLLGLAHSSVESAIMYPGIPRGERKDLNDDDIQGIKALYNN